MPHESAAASSEKRLAELFDELTRCAKSDGPGAVEAFLDAHPAEADELRRLLPVLSLLEDSCAVVSRAGDSCAARSAEGNASDATRLLDTKIEMPDGETPTDGVLGDFRIIREIGRGGMGVVYEARQISLKRRVALKVLPFAAILDEQQLQRFHNEAQAAAGLHHPNIVPVYSVGCERGVHFYAMQYIEGPTLAQLVAALRSQQGNRDAVPASRERIQDSGFGIQGRSSRNERQNLPPLGRGGQGGSRSTVEPNAIPAASPALSETGPLAALSTAHTRDCRAYFRKVAELGIQAAEALDYAHRQGIVHRDIKPANLLLDNSGKLWITDFGLARIGTDSNLTMTGDLLGTLRYMSPEQILAKRPLLDHRTDVYSLGITLYELLTFGPAYPESDRQALLLRIPQGNPKAPRAIRHQIPADLETIILRAIECDPGERYQTAREMADDLRHHLNDEPIRAKRPTLAQRVAKLSRRHRSVVVSTIAVMALSIVGLAVATTMIARERNAAEAAAANEQKGAQREQAAAKLARGQRRIAERQRDEARYNLYVADMQLAHQYWKTGQVERMLELLRAHVPHPGEVDLRGWEWRYLMALTRQNHTTLDGESGKITSLAWSPDGRMLATGGDSVKIWDVSSHRLVKTIAGAATTIPGISGIASNVAWSPDGKKLATAAPGNLVKIWNPHEAVEVLALGPLEMQPARICWSPDGRFLATSDREGSLLIWEAVADASPVRLRGKVADIWSLAWSPDGRSLAAGDGYLGVLDVWDAGQHTLRHSFKAHGHVISAIGWSPDGRFLATGSHDKHLKVWDARTCEAIVDQSANFGAIMSVAWSPDGKQLVTSSYDSTVKIWNAATGNEINMLRGHMDHVQAAAWSPSGDRLVSAGADGTVRLWESVETQDALYVSGSWPVVWSPDEKRLLGKGYNEGEFRIFDSNSGKIEREVKMEGLKYFAAFDWSPNGSVIAAGNFGGELLLLDAESGRELWRKSGCHLSDRRDQLAEVRSVAWNRDGSRLASAGADKTIKIWEPATGKLLETLHGHTRNVGSAIWSHDEKRLASKDGDQNVKIWNTSNWREELHLRCHPYASFAMDGRYSIAWSPDDSELAAGTSEGWIVIWNSITGRERLSFRAHAVNTRVISWSPDGTRIASGSEDNRVRIWDAATGREMLTFDGHTQTIMSVSWSPDGRRLATAASINEVPLIRDPATCIWDASRGYE